MRNECNFRLITMRDEGFPFHGLANQGEAGGHTSKVKVVLALYVMWFRSCYDNLYYIYNDFSFMILMVVLARAH